MRLFSGILILFSISLYGQPVKVMSFNIRYDTEADGIHQWKNRINHVAEVIRAQNPDILGLQEALNHQLQDLLRLLPEYAVFGVGRDDGKEAGEFSALLIRNSRFGVLEHSTTWLSETPNQAGSKSWDAAITRTATWARLFDKQTKREFLILNTHFDHVGNRARVNSAAIILNIIESKNLPHLITGDFNIEPSDSVYAQLTKTSHDARPTGYTQGTYCGFEGELSSCKTIDYIFHSMNWVVREFYIVQERNERGFPSDHLPVVAVFEFVAER